MVGIPPALGAVGMPGRTSLLLPRPEQSGILPAVELIAAADRPLLKEHWESLALGALPDETSIIARNVAISAQYARWYLQRPELKWAGMAAFASHHIGLALRVYADLSHVLEELLRAGRGPGTGDPRLGDLELVRQTNNRIYQHIGWAHLAYLSGGAPAVAAAIGDSPHADDRDLSTGFQTIAHGAQPAAGLSHAECADAIWKGNLNLLWIEQSRQVQPQFERFERDFRVFLTLCTSIDFDGNEFATDWKTKTIFPLYMLSFGLPTLLRSGHLRPNITNLSQRWFWCQSRIVRIWRQVEGTSVIRQRLQRIADESPATVTSI